MPWLAWHPLRRATGGRVALASPAAARALAGRAGSPTALPYRPAVRRRLAPVPASQHGHIVGEEDCLSVKVFAPAWTPEQVPQGSERRPVMVWIHGDGNAVGSAAGYDVTRNLAAQDGVIVVTVNYRLGLLGWFTHPALQAESGLSGEESSGNFAQLDLIAALRWVREHIATFGGDPGCVTVFGESAAARTCCCCSPVRCPPVCSTAPSRKVRFAKASAWTRLSTARTRHWRADAALASWCADGC